MSEGSKILVIDDEGAIREGLKSSLEGMGYDVTTAGSGEEGLNQLKNHSDISFVLTDFKMPGLNGMEVLQEVRRKYPDKTVAMMTGHGSIHHAVEMMKEGAIDYLSKPFSLEELEKILDKSFNPFKPAELELLTWNSATRDLLQKAKRIAQSEVPVLIEGPSGTGKELLARQIHAWSPRKNHPWVALNCAALPTGLLESELFGYEKGAFTGAHDKKIGRFEQADGGTILLDEIGELDPLLQAKLLRVLQEKEVDRLGGRKPLSINVRVIATTNKNLAELVKQGRFREDLYFRLYGVRFELPRLKDRRDDIAPLAERFLSREAAKLSRSLSYEPRVLEALATYDWPGNIRELERSVERAAALAEGAIVELHHFELPKESKILTSNIERMNQASSLSIKEAEQNLILKTLEQHQGNRTHTAKTLGMSLRTLRHKIKQYRDSGVEGIADRQSVTGKFCPDETNNAVLVPTSSASGPGQNLA